VCVWRQIRVRLFLGSSGSMEQDRTTGKCFRVAISKSRVYNYWSAGGQRRSIHLVSHSMVDHRSSILPQLTDLHFGHDQSETEGSDETVCRYTCASRVVGFPPASPETNIRHLASGRTHVLAAPETCETRSRSSAFFPAFRLADGREFGMRATLPT
jgi:hypothetical protein